ncbi:MAG: hypothetical protein C4321_10735 [Chloroflexota bacterium]
MPNLIGLIQLANKIKALKYGDFKWSGTVDGKPCTVNDYHLKVEGPEAVEVSVSVTADGQNLKLDGSFDPFKGGADDESLSVNGQDVDISADIDTYPFRNKMAIEYWFRWEEAGAPRQVYVRGTRRLF